MYINDTLFDVMFLDFWTPGEVPSKVGNLKVLAILLEGMRGFAGMTPLSEEYWLLLGGKLPSPQSTHGMHL